MEGKMPWLWFSIYVSLCRYVTLSACAIGLCFGMESLVYNISLCEYIEKNILTSILCYLFCNIGTCELLYSVSLAGSGLAPPVRCHVTINKYTYQSQVPIVAACLPTFLLLTHHGPLSIHLESVSVFTV